MSLRVTLIQGGGVGLDQIPAVQRILDRAGVAIDWDEHRAGQAALERGEAALPDALLQSVRQTGLALKTKLLSPPGEEHVNYNVQFRRSLGLFASVRPLKNLAGLPAHSLLACGPHGFVARVHDWWQAEPRDGRLQWEAFTAPAATAEAGEAVRLRFARSHRELPGNSAANLLEQAEAHGLRPPHGCRQGICTGCTCQLLAGSVRDLRTGAMTHGPGLPIRLCVSAPVGDVELEL